MSIIPNDFQKGVNETSELYKKEIQVLKNKNIILNKDNAIKFAKWVKKKYRYRHEKLLFVNTMELDYGDGITWDEAYKIYLTEK